ncbi:MAG: hypothetical protein ACLT98_18175 [Eggerthellaceae bacterium]
MPGQNTMNGLNGPWCGIANPNHKNIFAPLPLPVNLDELRHAERHQHEQLPPSART